MRFVASYFRNNGVEVWVDEHLEPGTPDWQKAIQNAIKNASCVVVILSPDSAESEWVGKELEFSKIHDLRIFPILARGDDKNTALLSLMGIQRTDIRDNYEQEMHKLLMTIKKHTGIQDSKKPLSISEDGIQWDRIGSLFWFASDCRLIRVQLLEGLGSPEELTERLNQIYHHAKRIQASTDTLEEIEKLLEIISQYPKDKWTSNQCSMLENRLRIIFYDVARQAEKADTNFHPGPKWKPDIPNS